MISRIGYLEEIDMWVRYADIRAIWRCSTTRGYETKFHAVGASIRDEYEKKPEEEIDSWSRRLGDFVARKMCQNACGSLSTSVFCDDGSVQSEIIYTSEILVPVTKEKEVKVVPPVLVPHVPVTVPKVVLDQIGTLEKRLAELEKRKSEIEKYISVAKGAIKRIKESGELEKLPGQEEALKRLTSELRVQNTVIKRQKEAIDKLKSQYGVE